MLQLKRQKWQMCIAFIYEKCRTNFGFQANERQQQKCLNASNALDIIFVIQHLKMFESSIVFMMKSTMDCLAVWVLFGSFVHTHTHNDCRWIGFFLSLFSMICWHSLFKRLMTDQKDEKSIRTDNRRDFATCGTLHHY